MLLNVDFVGEVEYLKEAFVALQACLSVPVSVLLNRHMTKVSATPNPKPPNSAPESDSIDASPQDIEDLSPINIQEDGPGTDETMDSGPDGDPEDAIEVAQEPLFAPPADNGCLSSGKWNIIRHWLETQQLALEIITNITFDDGESELFYIIWLWK